MRAIFAPSLKRTDSFTRFSLLFFSVMLIILIIFGDFYDFDNLDDFFYDFVDHNFDGDAPFTQNLFTEQGCETAFHICSFDKTGFDCLL